MSGYVFISNSTKPTDEAAKSRAPLSPSVVSRPCLETALDMGYDVYWGVNRKNPEELECDMPVSPFDSHTYRSITAFKDNKIAYQNLCRIIKNGNVEVIHCNTPVGGMVGRLAGKSQKVKKVIYTAHGFHFYKGAPFFNRTVLKFAEQIMARWTDVIITMNKEDYEAAKQFKLKKDGKVYLVHGVGINLDGFKGMSNHRNEKRVELQLEEDNVALISMGDLIPRKNYEVAIRAVAATNNPRVHYFICGKGPEEDNLKKLAQELNVENQVHFLGFRRDIKELLAASDIFLFTTKQEGMPRSMMEAMASGLPCIASKIRGNTDLLENTEGGFLCETTNVSEFAEKIKVLAENSELREKMSKNNLITIQNFSTETVKQEIRKIYETELLKNN